MDYPHLWSRLYGAPLAIHPEKAAIIEAVFRAHVAGGALPASQATPPERPPLESRAGVAFREGAGKPYAITESGIAVVPVLGTLVQRASGLDALSGLTSYSSIGRRIEAATEDRDVRAILLEVDSYGGEVHGLAELAETIAAAREAKPVWAAVNEQAYSAGYFLACAADRVTIPVSGATGSIGTLALHVDQSKRDASQGYAYTYVYAGARKKDLNPHEPLSDEARAVLQGEVDRHYGLFVAHVAARRALDEDAVRATEAGILAPRAALEGGFVDELATFAGTVALLQDGLRRQGFSSIGMRLAARRTSTSGKETPMADKPGNNAATELTAEQHQQVEARIAAARTEARTGALKEGSDAERARIKAIVSHAEAKDRPQLAMALALESEMSAEQAAKMLAAAPKEAPAKGGNALAQAMDKLKNPAVGADADEQARIEAARPRIDSKAIYDQWNQPRGAAKAH